MPKDETDAKNKWGYLNAILAAALFGGCVAFEKIAVGEVHPLIVAGATYLSAGLVLSLVRFSPLKGWVEKKLKLVHHEKKISGTDWIYIFLVALSGAAVGPVLYFYGLNYSSAVNASLLLNMEVLFTIAIALVFLKERASRIEYFAIALLFFSAIAVTTNFNFSLSLGGINGVIGNVLIIASTLFWAIDNSLSKKLSIQNDTLKVASFKSLIGGILLLVAAALLGVPFNNIKTFMIPYLILLGTFGVGLSVVFFLSALRRIGSMRTIAIYSTASIFGVISAFVFIGETVSAVQVVAGALMILAVYLLAGKRK